MNSQNSTSLRKIKRKGFVVTARGKIKRKGAKLQRSQRERRKREQKERLNAKVQSCKERKEEVSINKVL